MAKRNAVTIICRLAAFYPVHLVYVHIVVRSQNETPRVTWQPMVERGRGGAGEARLASSGGPRAWERHRGGTDMRSAAGVDVVECFHLNLNGK